MPRNIITENLLESTYFKKGIIGEDFPGASLIHFSLVVFPQKGTVSGIIEIIKSTGEHNIAVNVSGTIRSVDYGSVSKIINLDGSYTISVPPPAVGSFREHFSAYLDINNDWKGVGGFTFGIESITNVLVISKDWFLNFYSCWIS